MNNDPQKKTGATPLVDQEGLGGGRVLGVVDVKTVLVNYVDGHGEKGVKLAVVIPGGEVYFFSRDSIDTRPAQTWMKSAIIERIKE